ncbi:hypothetical protein QBC46DRAFT_408434 [Diplogelasinospora grovesii]|uniref:C2H2-type domain-containing protein n=1 Tax=Diplogelasinospora grovesii TaxID=303347 RepID=A0AAN6N710_9PEZI|nr:hypothetical protein QBC46DRAFT_408434 [Diplogelasinospora grovesii]
MASTPLSAASAFRDVLRESHSRDRGNAMPGGAGVSSSLGKLPADSNTRIGPENAGELSPRPVFKMKRTGGIAQEMINRVLAAPQVSKPTDVDTQDDPPPAMVVSDTMPSPALPPGLSLPTSLSTPRAHVARSPNPSVSEETRRKPSESMAQSWAEGSMEKAMRKAQETKKRKRHDDDDGHIDEEQTPRESDIGFDRRGLVLGPSRRRRLSENSSPAANEDKQKPQEPSRVPPHFTNAPSGRSYKEWPDENGKLSTTAGVILPDKYELDLSVPGCPWICPVNHGSVLLNDSLDGTLAVIGKYKPPPGDGKKKAGAVPMVVSQMPVNPDEHPLVIPKVGPYANGKALKRHSTSSALQVPAELALSEELDYPVSGSSESESSPEPESDDEVRKYEMEKSLPSPIRYATYDRPYTHWRDESGVLLPGYGALFPEGYKLLPSSSGLQWVCPVRSCGGQLEERRRLGHHFVRKHNRHMLNDNGDGTFTDLGLYDGPALPDMGNLGTNAFVVSQTPMGPDEVAPVGITSTGFRSARRSLRRSNHSAIEEVNPGDSEESDNDIVASATYELTSTPHQDEDNVIHGKEKIVNAPDGRPYTFYRDSNGQLSSAYGALIPQGYQTGTDPYLPWVCPVRSCRKGFIRPVNMGCHFVAAHRAKFLHDNLDGTFTELGSYNNNAKGKHPRLPSYVISQGSPDPNQSGLTAPKPAEHDATKTVVTEKNALLPPGNPKAMWEYVRPLFPNLTPDEPAPYTRWPCEELLTLARVRDVTFNQEWLERSRAGFTATQKTDITSLLIQVTGTPAAKPCVYCSRGLGPYVGCMLVAPTASAKLKTSITGCANCFYKNQQAKCSLYRGTGTSGVSASYQGSLRESTGSQRETLREKAIRQLQRVAQSENQTQLESDSEGETPPVYRRCESCIRRKQRCIPSHWASGAEAAEVSTTGSVPEPLVNDTRSHDDSSNNGRQHETRGAARRAGEPSPAAVIMSTGQLHAEDVLEMEDWEVAPGRIRQEGGDTVAYSQSYLSTFQTVQVTSDLGYRVDRVLPGSTHRFEADAEKIRLISVAQGKVRVRFDKSGEEFAIGPHGMFKLPAQMGCSVLNRMYCDAVLHVHASVDYSN